MLTAQGLTFSYNRKPLLRGLSFTVRPGECVVLAGPNGSGKSTALSLIAGVLKPSSGSASADGSIGYVPQGTALFEDMSVADNLRFFAGLAGASVPKELPLGVGRYLKKKVSSLSGGTKKRVSIACALLGDPDNLLFDEPCSGLDLTYRDELTELILDLKKRGRSILYVGHETSEFAAFYDRLIFLGGAVPQQFESADLSGPSGDLIQKSIKLNSAYRALCKAVRSDEEGEQDERN